MSSITSKSNRWVIILLLTWIITVAGSGAIAWFAAAPRTPSPAASFASPAPITTPIVVLYQCDRKPMPPGVCAVDAMGHVGPCHGTCGGIDIAAQARRHPWRLHAGPCLAR